MKGHLFLFHGDEALLVENQVKTLESQYPDHYRILFQENASLDELFTLTGGASLFAAQHLIIAKQSPYLKNALSDSEFNVITQCCENAKLNGHILCFYSPGTKCDMRKKLTKYIKKSGHVAEFKGFSDWDQQKLYTWIQDHVQKNGKLPGWSFPFSI